VKHKLNNAKEGNGEYWVNTVAIFCDNGVAVIFSSRMKLASTKERILEGLLQHLLWKWTSDMYIVERYAYTQNNSRWDDIWQRFCFHKRTVYFKQACNMVSIIFMPALL